MTCSTSFIAIGCTHFRYHHEPYIKWVLNQVDEYKPDVFVHCGDLIDQECVSKFAKSDSSTLKQEYDEANSFLDELNHKLPENCKKVYTTGNHCTRIFRQEHKHLSDLLDFRIHMDALKDWTVFDYRFHPNHVFRLGQVTFAHGFGTTDRAIVNETVKLGVPYGLYVHAHLHRGCQPKQVYWSSLGLPYWYANVGCGIRSDVEYFKEKDVSQWNRGMVMGHIEKGRFDRPRWKAEFLEHSRIWDG